MFTHEPADYTCPFCAFLQGKDDKYSERQDIVYQNEHATAFIAPKWWRNNTGHVLVVPNSHTENIYTISDDALAQTYAVVKKVAIAMRNTYDCAGTSTRQHNEPAGNQDVWHFHVHVFPRYDQDNLYANHADSAFVDAAARAPYAQKLRDYFAAHSNL